VKFDLILPGASHIPTLMPWSHHLSADGFRAVLSTADELGYHAVLISEHLGTPHFEVPRLGAFWHEPMALMAFCAACTQRIRLDHAVLVLPYHHPLRLAKSLATIDLLSGGRVEVSVGVGHAVAEFAAMNVPFAERGALTDEILAALDTLWTQDEPEHHGTYFDVGGLAVEPKPVQKPRPSIHVGGNSKPALRRAARFEGWQPNPTNFSIEEIPPLLDYLRAQPDFAGKEDSYEVTWLEPPAGAELPTGFAGASAVQLRAYGDRLLEAYTGEYTQIGITRTVPDAPGIASLPEYLDFLRWFDDTVGAALVVPTAT
jgi:probable F420-dependent oxidoreductase